MIRRLLLRAAAVGVLAWTAWAGLAGMEDVLQHYDQPDRVNPSAIEWRFGIAPVIRLERFAAAARPLLPPRGGSNERIAFASPPEPRADLFYRHRWAAYLLPEVDLLPWDDPAGRRCRYLLAWSFEPHEAGGTPLHKLHDLPGGALYEVPPR